MSCVSGGSLPASEFGVHTANFKELHESVALPKLVMRRKENDLRNEEEPSSLELYPETLFIRLARNCPVTLAAGNEFFRSPKELGSLFLSGYEADVGVCVIALRFQRLSPPNTAELGGFSCLSAS